MVEDSDSSTLESSDWLEQNIVDDRPLNRVLGIAGGTAADGQATCQVVAVGEEPTPTTFAITSAVDIALVRAAATTVAPPEEMNGTAELNVSYLRAPVGTAQVRCDVVGRSPTARLVEFTVADAEGEFARGRSTYAVRTRRPR